MAPSHSPLHGLNLVVPPHPGSGPTADDALLADSPFPDLAAQLDLWTNLTFQTDEPLHAARRDKVLANDEETEEDGDENDADKDDADVQPAAADSEGTARLDAHVNAVRPPNSAFIQQQQQQQQQQNPIDVFSLLSGYPIDPLLSGVPSPSSQSASTPTLAQLLSGFPFTQPQMQFGQIPPQLLQQQLPGLQPAPTQSQTTVQPAAKRSRSRKTSIASTVEPSVPIASAASSASTSSPDPSSELNDGTPQGLSAAEDKRRRNTAASARFRLKKKEREAALERRAAELEQRVGTLERECEALRRENGWLKGLVVGVTGAGAVPTMPGSTSPQPQVTQTGQGQGTGAKRKRDEDARPVPASA